MPTTAELIAMAEAEDEEKTTAQLIAEAESENKKEPTRLFGLPESMEKAVFPTTGVSAIGKDARKPSKSFSQALEAIGTPVRLLGKLRGYEAKDPESALFRPEMEKLKSMVPESKPGFGGPLSNEMLAKGGIELLGSVASDPLFLGSVGKKAIEKPAQKVLKGTAKKIEAGLLKPKEAVLRKAPIDDLTENVLKERTLSTGKKLTAAGSLKATTKKIKTIFDDLEKQIDNTIDDAIAKNPNTKIDMDNIMSRVQKRINQSGQPGTGDDLFFGMEEQAQKALEGWGKSISQAAPEYAQTGKLTLKEAQKIKRLLNKKGFKKGAAPSSETVPKENVVDVLALELKDEIEKKVPQIKSINQVYKELIPVKKAAENATQREGKKDLVGIVTALAGGGGAQLLTPGSFGAEDIAAGLGAMGLYKATRSGRTAQTLGYLGRQIGKSGKVLPPVSGIASGVSGDKDEENISTLDRFKRKR